ncbi:MAG: MFS transporter [Actinomycetota bacterium]
MRPVRRMWSSDDPLDDYALVHFASSAGDALVTIALADSVFFSIPVDEARTQVALYLVLTLAPLAVAAPLLVPLLDRVGPRRTVSFASAIGRLVVALYAAPRIGSVLLFPAVFILLVLSKIHQITKNGLTLAYAPPDEGLLRSNARMGRVAAAGFILAAGPGLVASKLGGPSAALYAAAAVYGVTMLLNLRLPTPAVPPRPPAKDVQKLGRVPSLTLPAAGAAGLRAASGFLLFLLAFALRRSPDPGYWFVVLVIAGMTGVFVADFLAPRLPRALREEAVVVGSLIGAGLAAVIAFGAFALVVLSVFALVAGMATELGRLAFQSLMQRRVPAGAFGRVFARYEVLFQLAWVTGAFMPAFFPIEFRTGILIMAGFYLVFGITTLWQLLQARQKALPPEGGSWQRPL